MKALPKKLILVVYLCCLAFSVKAAEVEPLTIVSPQGTHQFEVEVARTAEEREKGLMNRMDLPADHGMLFVLDDSQPVAMWMKNTYIPLDMVFMDQEGRVLAIHPNATPLSKEKIIPPEGTHAVLELNGGDAAAKKIIPGSQVQHSLVHYRD